MGKPQPFCFARRIFVLLAAIPDKLDFVSRNTFTQWAEQIWDLEKILKAQGLLFHQPRGCAVAFVHCFEFGF